MSAICPPLGGRRGDAEVCAGYYPPLRVSPLRGGVPRGARREGGGPCGARGVPCGPRAAGLGAAQAQSVRREARGERHVACSGLGLGLGASVNNPNRSRNPNRDRNPKRNRDPNPNPNRNPNRNPNAAAPVGSARIARSRASSGLVRVG